MAVTAMCDGVFAKMASNFHVPKNLHRQSFIVHLPNSGKPTSKLYSCMVYAHHYLTICCIMQVIQYLCFSASR